MKEHCLAFSAHSLRMSKNCYHINEILDFLLDKQALPFPQYNYYVQHPEEFNLHNVNLLQGLSPTISKISVEYSAARDSVTYSFIMQDGSEDDN